MTIFIETTIYGCVGGGIWLIVKTHTSHTQFNIYEYAPNAIDIDPIECKKTYTIFLARLLFKLYGHCIRSWLLLFSVNGLFYLSNCFIFFIWFEFKFAVYFLFDILCVATKYEYLCCDWCVFVFQFAYLYSNSRICFRIYLFVFQFAYLYANMLLFGLSPAETSITQTCDLNRNNDQKWQFFSNTSVMNFWMQIGIYRSVWIIDILHGILSFEQFMI